MTLPTMHECEKYPSNCIQYAKTQFSSITKSNDNVQNIEMDCDVCTTTIATLPIKNATAIADCCCCRCRRCQFKHICYEWKTACTYTHAYTHPKHVNKYWRWNATFKYIWLERFHLRCSTLFYGISLSVSCPIILFYFVSIQYETHCEFVASGVFVWI